MAAPAEISRHLRNLLPPGTVRQQALVSELLVAPASNVQTRETRSVVIDGRPARAAGAGGRRRGKIEDISARRYARMLARESWRARDLQSRAPVARLSIVCTLFCKIQQLLQRYPHRVVELMCQLKDKMSTSS